MPEPLAQLRIVLPPQRRRGWAVLAARHTQLGVDLRGAAALVGAERPHQHQDERYAEDIAECMRTELAALQPQWKAKGYPEIKIGVINLLCGGTPRISTLSPALLSLVSTSQRA